MASHPEERASSSAPSRAPQWAHEDGVALVLLTVALLIGATLRIWLALHDDGIYWPDEVYQSLEPAHRLVFGYGLVAWEFVEGARNWTFPGFVAFWLEVCRWFGVVQPRTYLTVVRLVFVALSLGCAWGAYLLALAYGARRLQAAASAALCAWLAPLIYFAPRAMSEGASAVLVVLGFALALAPAADRGRSLAGASLIGLSVCVRLQCGLFAVALLAILVLRRRFQRALDALAALLLFAFLFGLVDHLTWAGVPGARYDGWFHSALEYVQFTVVDGRASDWGMSPWSYYFTSLFTSAPVAVAFAALLSLVAMRRALGLWMAVATYVGLHAMVPHKELRFIIPALPLLCALAGIGLGAIRQSLVRSGLTAVVVLAAALSAARFHTLTFRDLGHETDRADASAYDDSGPVNRLLIAAHDSTPLCGVRIDDMPLAWTGGYSFLHRRVPLFSTEQAPLDRGWISHVIGRATSHVPGEVVARDGDWVLVVLPERPCQPAPNYSGHL